MIGPDFYLEAVAGSGAAMHGLMANLFPICRSLTGPGVRETLRILGDHIPLNVHEVPTGTQAFDWEVPDEWSIRDAFVKDQTGRKVIDFTASNLHVVGYSEPVDAEMVWDELRPHLHSRPDLPEAIPYLTSYYARQWGFCLSENTLREMEAAGAGPYHVVIDSTLAPGSMTYADLVIPGEEETEILLSTYICHPSMANNELSGPALLTFLAKHLMKKTRRFTYRLVWVPETLGALVYLSRYLDDMKARTHAGYVVSCVGGPSGPTYLESRRGDHVVDRVTAHILAQWPEDHRLVSYMERGSDERQYCAPGIDLPIGSLMRSKYYDYDGYHTSLDDLTFVQPEHLEKSLALYLACLDALEENRRWRLATMGEPQLGKRGLYPNLGAQTNTARRMAAMMALMGYCDGETDLVAIAEANRLPVWDLYDPARSLVDHGLLIGGVEA